MAIKDSLLPEFDHEMGSTRRLLERVPHGDFAWRPHEKSFTMGELAAHIANLPNWAVLTCEQTIFELDAIAEQARPTVPATSIELLQRFDANVQAARRKIDEQTDAALVAPWTLKQGGHEMFTMPRVAVLRSFVMNHLIHHRGQMTVYLRLRNIPLPSIYGPTADEG